MTTTKETDPNVHADTHEHVGHVHGPGCAHGDHAPYVRAEPKLGRNDLCACGSGKKYKKCCLKGG